MLLKSQAELLEWMRLSPDHPHYLLDGLNRDALAMNAVEATAARYVLGSLFKPLDRLGIAASLLSDSAKTASAAAIVLFCRPVGEDPLTTGRHFYRSWLEIDRAGLAACPISALADHPDFNDRLRKLGKIGTDLRLVNVFRVSWPAKPLKTAAFPAAGRSAHRVDSCIDVFSLRGPVSMSLENALGCTHK